mgnify:FL=1
MGSPYHFTTKSPSRNRIKERTGATTSIDKLTNGVKKEEVEAARKKEIALANIGILDSVIVEEIAQAIDQIVRIGVNHAGPIDRRTRRKEKRDREK